MEALETIRVARIKKNCCRLNIVFGFQNYKLMRCFITRTYIDYASFPRKTAYKRKTDFMRNDYSKGLQTTLLLRLSVAIVVI